MAEAQRMKLLLYDTKFFYHAHLYKELAEKFDIEITRLFDLEDIEKTDTANYNGFIVHTSMSGQREFSHWAMKHPNLRIAVVSNDIGDYDTTSLDFAVINVRNFDKINEYFANNSRSLTERVNEAKTP